MDRGAHRMPTIAWSNDVKRGTCAGYVFTEIIWNGEGGGAGNELLLYPIPSYV